MCNNDDQSGDNAGYWSYDIIATDPVLLPPDNKTLIDVHVHLFDGPSVLSDIFLSGWTAFLEWVGREPDAESKDQSWFDAIKIEFSHFVEMWRQIMDRSVEINLNNTTQGYINSGILNKFNPAKSKVAIVPLMMDLYYYCLNEKKQTTQVPLVPNQYSAQFQQYSQWFTDKCKDEITRRNLGFDLFKFLEEGVKSLCRSILAFTPHLPKHQQIYSSIFLTPGYQKQMEDLQYLQGIRPKDQIYPFLAIDPRRPGIEELVQLKLNGGRGPFAGIKLYPPLGYLPTHPDLVRIFEYCEQCRIPVTVHCSNTGGMVTANRKIFVRSVTPKAGLTWNGSEFNGVVEFPDEQLVNHYFTCPKNWEPVLEKYRTLRLNFAHFGGFWPVKMLASTNSAIAACDNNCNPKVCKANWAKVIIDFMERKDPTSGQKKFPNVYCDISYFIEGGKNISIEDFNKILDAHPILKQRLMFGTDYWMIMLEKSLSWQISNYLNMYHAYAEKFPGIFYENVKEFLSFPRINS